MTRTGSALLFVTLFLVFLLGLLISSTDPSRQYQAAIEALHLETAGKMAHLKVIFWYSLAAIALCGLAVGAGVTVYSFWQRSRLIYPADGLYPVVRERARDGHPYYHDPNRQLAGSVAYRDGPEGIEAQTLLPAGMEDAQHRVTTQAQAAQVIAAGKGQESRTARRTVERMTTLRPAPRMPQIYPLSADIPEERYLLAALRHDWEGENRDASPTRPPETL